MSLPFMRDRVEFGARLVLAKDESIEFTFRGMGHGSDVIATRVVPIPGRPIDVIGRQKDFRVPGEHYLASNEGIGIDA